MATISKYETASGATLYRVRYRTPERGQTDKRGFTTKRDAEAFTATVEVTKMRGEYVAPSLGRVTIGQLGPAWLARQKGHMKPSGFRSYESAWRVHVEPRWAGLRVADWARARGRTPRDALHLVELVVGRPTRPFPAGRRRRAQGGRAL